MSATPSDTQSQTPPAPSPAAIARYALTRCAIAPRQPRSSSAGFSIVEMLAVLVLIAIASVFASQSWLAFTENRRASSAQTAVINALRSAQERANNTSSPQYVLVGEAGGEVVYSIAPTTNSTPTFTSLDDDLVSISSTTGTTETTAGETYWRVEFDHRGNTEDLGQITLQSGNATRCVIVSTRLGALRAEANDECS